MIQEYQTIDVASLILNGLVFGIATSIVITLIFSILIYKEKKNS